MRKENPTMYSQIRHGKCSTPHRTTWGKYKTAGTILSSMIAASCLDF